MMLQIFFLLLLLIVLWVISWGLDLLLVEQAYEFRELVGAYKGNL